MTELCEFCKHCGQGIVTVMEHGVQGWVHSGTGRTVCDECIEGGKVESLSVAEPLSRPKMSAAELAEEEQFWSGLCDSAETEGT
jgi:hypothetical protein